MSGHEPHRDVLQSVENAIGEAPRASGSRVAVTFIPPDIVALAGQVASLAEVEQIGRLATQAAGGYHIDNSLTVGVNRPDSDAELAREAQERLAHAGFSTVGVQVRDGIALLRGTATSLGVADRARAVVSEVMGIKAIRSDHLAVAREQVAGADIPADIDEATIADGVEDLLVGLLPPAGGRIEIRVTHRTVVLGGMVPSDLERTEAERLAREVPGVAHVINMLECQDGTAGWNERLAAEIRHRLGQPHDHASPVDIKVFVVRGAVYLFGTADFPEQVDQARDIVREVAGDVAVYSEVVVSSRHPRPAGGPGKGVEDAR